MPWPSATRRASCACATEPRVDPRARTAARAGPAPGRDTSRVDGVPRGPRVSRRDDAARPGPARQRRAGDGRAVGRARSPDGTAAAHDARLALRAPAGAHPALRTQPALRPARGAVCLPHPEPRRHDVRRGVDRSPHRRCAVRARDHRHGVSAAPGGLGAGDAGRGLRPRGLLRALGARPRRRVARLVASTGSVRRRPRLRVGGLGQSVHGGRRGAGHHTSAVVCHPPRFVVRPLRGADRGRGPRGAAALWLCVRRRRPHRCVRLGG
jgi:hypothetical protein